jgi:hypothetical protein
MSYEDQYNTYQTGPTRVGKSRLVDSFDGDQYGTTTTYEEFGTKPIQVSTQEFTAQASNPTRVSQVRKSNPYVVYQPEIVQEQIYEQRSPYYNNTNKQVIREQAPVRTIYRDEHVPAEIDRVIYEQVHATYAEPKRSYIKSPVPYEVVAQVQKKSYVPEKKAPKIAQIKNPDVDFLNKDALVLACANDWAVIDSGLYPAQQPKIEEEDLQTDDRDAPGLFCGMCVAPRKKKNKPTSQLKPEVTYEETQRIIETPIVRTEKISYVGALDNNFRNSKQTYNVSPTYDNYNSVLGEGSGQFVEYESNKPARAYYANKNQGY